MPSNISHDAAAVRVFPPAIPAAVILLGALLDYVLPLSFVFRVAPSLRYWIGGVIIAGSVLGLGLWAVLVVRRSGDQTENPWGPTTAIVERGPFRVSRNPMYLQMIVVCIGFSILLWNLWILLLTPICGWLLRRWAIEPEEAYLERKFGDAYRSYKRRVRRWI